MDNRSRQKRSYTMSRVRGRDTSPELVVRRTLHRLGYRYRLHRKDLPGRPDIVFPARKKAIFVHGCYWHAHGCRYGKPPRSRLDYWLPKLEANKERDARALRGLEDLGWETLVIWQCQIKEGIDIEAVTTDFLDEGPKLLASCRSV